MGGKDNLEQRQHELEQQERKKRTQTVEVADATEGPWCTYRLSRISSILEDEKAYVTIFIDCKDNLDGYLRHFESGTVTDKWERIEWIILLGALINIKTPEMCLLIFQLMLQLIMTDLRGTSQVYDLSDDGYRGKCCKSIPMNNLCHSHIQQLF